ncbi:MAG: glycosyltransferase family 4 protein [Bacteroidia bacterium]|nr:glycosyltransferase family 4 protein [Bacteroidia bacterium]
MKDEGFKLIPIGLRRANRNPFREIASIIEIINIYRAEQPDIVHHVALKPVLYGSLAAWIVKKTFVTNALIGLGFIFISDKWYVRILRIIISVALKFALNGKHSKLILQNPDDIKLLLKSDIVKRDNIVLIKGSGVDANKFRPSPECPGELMIVLVSRMLWDKGVGEFVSAARILKQEGTNARFVLVGKTDPDNPASIPTSTLTSWQDQGVIEWWGYHENIAAIFEKSHVVCLPSYREGLPKVLIEAAACGRPIVTTDTPGCREIVQDGINGFLVPLRDDKALADALRRLIRDPKLRNEMGKKGRDLVLNEYTVDRVVEETLALYKANAMNSG